VLALVIISACDGGDDDELSGTARIYIAAVRSVAEAMPPDVEDREKLPVVYVVSNNAEPIAADVQAEVASVLDPDADVRFADAREEALDLGKPHEPVRSEGRLLTVGPVEDDAAGVDVVDLQVEIYRSDEEWSRGVVTMERSAEDWAVTSSSIVEVVAPPSSVPVGSSVPGSSVPAETSTSS